jgi:hypothetical protein
MTYCGGSELSRRSTGLTLGGVIYWLVVVLSGCAGNGAKGGEVRDDARYSACSRAQPAAPRSGSSGSVAFNLTKRTLTLKPGAAGVRIAVFSGGSLSAPTPEVLTYLRETQADVFVVLGGLGRSSAQATAAARTLGALERPVLWVRGGADGAALEGTAAPSLVLDASGIRSVRVGQDNFVLWPGSDQGRYALDAQHCGFSEAELTQAADELGAREDGERRWLLSWQAPGPGSPLAAFVTRVRMDGVLYAWPAPAEPPDAGTPWDRDHPRLVPRAWGPRLDGPDGRLLPLGALVLQVERDGPHIAR